MENANLRYSQTDLKEFETLIQQKLEGAQKELLHLKGSITRSASGTDNNHSSYVTMDDGADALEKEQLNQLAARTQKYIMQLENALVRIKTGTYGVCVDTGKLISRDRLKAVPHTMHSIEAKRAK